MRATSARSDASTSAAALAAPSSSLTSPSFALSAPLRRSISSCSCLRASAFSDARACADASLELRRSSAWACASSRDADMRATSARRASISPAFDVLSASSSLMCERNDASTAAACCCEEFSSALASLHFALAALLSTRAASNSPRADSNDAVSILISSALASSDASSRLMSSWSSLHFSTCSSSLAFADS